MSSTDASTNTQTNNFEDKCRLAKPDDSGRIPCEYKYEQIQQTIERWYSSSDCAKKYGPNVCTYEPYNECIKRGGSHASCMTHRDTLVVKEERCTRWPILTYSVQYKPYSEKR